MSPDSAAEGCEITRARLDEVFRLAGEYDQDEAESLIPKIRNECALAIASLLKSDPIDDDLYLPASSYSDIPADTRRQAKQQGRVRSRKGNGNRNLYNDADVRKNWPHKVEARG